MSESIIVCPICNSKDNFIWQSFLNSSIFINNKFLPLEGEKIGCVNCNHIFSTIDPEKHQMEKFYHDQNRQRHSSKNPNALRIHGYYNDAVNLISNFILKRKKDISVLDIGCGNGELLSSLKEKFPAINAYGIDINESAKEVIGSDINILIGTFPKTKFKNKKYDLVIVNGVLEHQKNVYQFLIDIENILNEDGEVFFEVPDSLSILVNRQDLGEKIIHDLFNHEHIHHFSISSFFYLFQKSGWSIQDHQLVTKGIWNAIQVRIKKSPPKIYSSTNIEKIDFKLAFEKFVHSKKILKNKIALIFENNHNIGIYAAGWHTSVVLPQLFPKLKTLPFKIFDSDLKKHNSEVLGKHVMLPQKQDMMKLSKIIISTIEGNKEIEEILLKKFGISDSLIKLY